MGAPPQRCANLLSYGIVGRREPLLPQFLDLIGGEPVPNRHLPEHCDLLREASVL
jgi:hypothetical protein